MPTGTDDEFTNDRQWKWLVVCKFSGLVFNVARRYYYRHCYYRSSSQQNERGPVLTLACIAIPTNGMTEVLEGTWDGTFGGRARSNTARFLVFSPAHLHLIGFSGSTTPPYRRATNDMLIESTDIANPCL
jgi:hypothetical protein